MMEPLFGTRVVEVVLFYVTVRDSCYASGVQREFDLPLYSVQRALKKLEKGGILVSFSVGKTLNFQFNPRYPFLPELRTFLEKAYHFLPAKERERYEKRKRPRRSGKPL